MEYKRNWYARQKPSRGISSSHLKVEQIICVDNNKIINYKDKEAIKTIMEKDTKLMTCIKYYYKENNFKWFK